MKKVIAKLLLSFLASIVLLMNIVTPSFAQFGPGNGQVGPWYNQTYDQWQAKVFGGDQNEIFGERYTYAQVTWIIDSLIAIIMGQNVSQCTGSTDKNQLKGCLDTLSGVASAPSTSKVASGSSLLFLAALTNSTMNYRAASGIDYVKATASHLHLISPAYAQTTGAGFQSIALVQRLWAVIRDIAFGLMIVVVIVMAFMIMFRMKISPQVVVSVQSALPKIAIGIVLIQFSYAIAGFVIDLAYVALGIFAVAIQGIGGQNITTYANPVELFNQLNSGNGFVSIIVGLIIVGVLLLVGSALVLPSGALLFFSGVLTPIGIGLLAGIVVIILMLIIVVVILVRVLWLLLRTGCIIVLLVIASPIMILMGVFSGSSGFMKWLRLLLANAAVYPTVAIMIFMSHYFFWAWFMSTGPNGTFLAECHAGAAFNTFCIQTNSGVAGNLNLPGAVLSTSVLGFVFSLIVLALIPKAAQIIESLIQGRGFDIGGAAAEGVTGPFRSGMRLAGTGIGLADVGLDAYLAMQFARGASAERYAARSGPGRLIAGIFGGRNQNNVPVAPQNSPLKTENP